MITSKHDLQEHINADNAFYKIKGCKNRFISILINDPRIIIERFLVHLRKQEFYINTAKGNKLKGLLGLYHERKKNKLGYLIGIEIGPNCFGKGLHIFHGNIVVNAAVRAGDNCRLRCCNCIGNIA